MMPPKNLEPTALWSTLTTMPRPFRVVPFPRKLANGNPAGQYAVRALNQGEHIAATVAAEKSARDALPNAKANESIGYEVTYSNAVSVEIIYRAARDAEDLDRAAFPSPKAIRDNLTTDEIGVLFAQYMDVSSEVGPIIGSLSEEEANAWIERLIAGGEAADPIPFLSSEAKATLLRSSVSQLRNCRMALSSAGLPLDGRTTERSEHENDRLHDTDAIDRLDDAAIDDVPDDDHADGAA